MNGDIVPGQRTVEGRVRIDLSTDAAVLPDRTSGDHEMLRLNDVELTYGGQVIFGGVNWQTTDHDRVGLVGPNGSGKTTLLKIISGEVNPDRGEVILPRASTIGHMPQELIGLRGRSVFEEVLSVFSDVLRIQERTREIEGILSTRGPNSPGYQEFLDEYGQLQDSFATREGYRIEARIGEVLNGLGFQPEDRERSVEEFSGGWQMRLVLAKLLLSEPAVLLLDEPTNHLDLEARNWLEEYLADYPGTIILVSHDRYFLDTVTHRITEIENGSIIDYHATYSGYVKEKEARYERLAARAKRQQEEIRRIRTFIEKFRYDKRRASLVQSRVKMLDKMETIDLPPRPRKIRFRFPDPPRSGRAVLELKDIDKAYGDIEVFRDLDLIVERGERIGLVGPNGAGKSTLMRIMAGTEPVDRGEVKYGHNVSFRFMDQQVTASLNMENLVLNELQDAAPLEMRTRIRSLLGAFLFSGDDVDKKISVLSGGEKSRVAIAKMLLEASNLLLLDEPTNHLDIFSQEILLAALERFSGTIVFVSHERYFINKLAGKIIEVGKGHLTIYPGNYEDYLAKKAREEAGEEVRQEDHGRMSRKEAALREREERKRVARDERRRLRKLEDLEKTIHEKEARLQELEHLLADPELYREEDKARELVTGHRRLQSEIRELYDRWLALGEADTDRPDET